MILLTGCLTLFQYIYPAGKKIINSAFYDDSFIPDAHIDYRACPLQDGDYVPYIGKDRRIRISCLRFAESRPYSFDETAGMSFGRSRFDSGVYRSTIIVAQYQDEPDRQVGYCIFYAAYDEIIDNVAGYTKNEYISYALIEYYLRRDPGI